MRLNNYLWTIDVYDSDQLDKEAMSALIKNTDNAILTSSEGFTAYLIVRQIKQYTDKERETILEPKKSDPWAVDKFEVKLQNVARLLQVIREESYHKWIEN